MGSSRNTIWTTSFVVALTIATAVAVGGCSAMRVWFPAHDYDDTPPSIRDDLRSPAVLFFTKTNGFRHVDAIPASATLFRGIAEKRGWGIYETENAAIHNSDQLERFDAVVWSNVSGDVLNDEQKQAFKEWLEGGGGFVGIHGTGGDPSYKWDWYVETLIGAQFNGHPMNPQFQEATIVVEDQEHPATRHLPRTWVRTDEWYSFEESPRGEGVRILATLDESSYSPRFKMLLMDRDLSMGDDHPILWSQCIGKGRAFYSALGHQGSAYGEPEYAGLLEEATTWAMGLHDARCQ